MRFGFRLTLAVFAILISVSSAQSQDNAVTAVEPSTEAPVTKDVNSSPPDVSGQPGPSQTVPAAVDPRLPIGPGDEIEIAVYGAPDLTQKVRVTAAGEVSLALVGNVHVGGSTADQAATVIERKYREGGFLNDPHITVYVKEYRSQIASVSGEVQKPGIYPITNARRVLDVILLAGGFSPKAGKTITINHADGSKATVVTLTDDPVQNAESNIAVAPGDSIVVSKAGIVYVLGEVTRAGGFILENQQPMTVLQAIALAAGPTRLASLNHTRLLHRTPNGLQETEIPLKKILQAKAPDIPLQPDDILFVPGSAGKMALHGSTSLASTAAAAAIYRF